MSETAAIVSPALALLHAAGVLCWRNNVDQRGRVKCGLGTGSADIIGVLPGSGRFFALECKTPTGKTSKAREEAQCAWGHAVIRNNARWAIVKSPEQAIEMVRQWQRWEGSGQ